MDKLNVAVLFGGRSDEHDVSVKSAQEVAACIDLDKYEPIYINITRAGAWRICSHPSPEGERENDRPVALMLDGETRGFVAFDDDRTERILVDVALPMIHGKTGEDGTIQGLLELSGIPYVGCDAQSSVLCMDKALTHTVARQAGIATPDFWVLDEESELPFDIDAYPVFVKPARSGSSFGITKVTRADELVSAIKSARKFDKKVVVEQAIQGSEVGCAILGNGSNLTTGAVDQITLSHGFFRIHQESKPEDGSENSSVHVPADLPKNQSERIKETAKAIYQALGCRGLARVDLFLQEDGRIVLNEVNTMPGFTSYSRYPRMMLAAGITRTEIIDRLITLALKE